MSQDYHCYYYVMYLLLLLLLLFIRLILHYDYCYYYYYYYYHYYQPKEEPSAPPASPSGTGTAWAGARKKGHVGSLRFFLFLFFDGGTCWVPIFRNLSTSVNFAHLFPQSVKVRYFCSGPISVDPICPEPKYVWRIVWLIVLILDTRTSAKTNEDVLDTQTRRQVLLPKFRYNILFSTILYCTILHYTILVNI